MTHIFYRLEKPFAYFFYLFLSSIFYLVRDHRPWSHPFVGWVLGSVITDLVYNIVIQEGEPNLPLRLPPF